MSVWQEAILTNDGLALQARATAGETKITFSKIVVGDGEAETIETLTNVVNPIQTAGISSASYSTPNKAIIYGTVDNSELDDGYFIKEYGLFAKDDDNNEYLYAYAVDTAPDYFPAYIETTAMLSVEFGLVVAISNASSITVELTQTGMASVLDVVNHIANHDSDSSAHPSILSQLAQCANKNMSNLSAAGKSAFFPSNSSISVSMGTSSPENPLSYTAPANGYLFIMADRAVGTALSYALINNITSNLRSVCYAYHDTGIAAVGTWLPLKKGDSVNISFLNVSNKTGKFVYSSSEV